MYPFKYGVNEANIYNNCMNTTKQRQIQLLNQRIGYYTNGLTQYMQMYLFKYMTIETKYMYIY